MLRQGRQLLVFCPERATTQATAGDAPSQRRGRRGVLGGCASVPANCCLHPTMLHLYCSSPSSCRPAFLPGYPAIAPAISLLAIPPSTQVTRPLVPSLSHPLVRLPYLCTIILPLPLSLLPFSLPTQSCPAMNLKLPYLQTKLPYFQLLILYRLEPKVTLPSNQVTLLSPAHIIPP